MCGIAGIVGLPREHAEPRVRAALDRLAHRGPDGMGLLAADDAVIGMRRLAIIDLEGGDQPIWNEDRTVGCVCNGELYNYVEAFAALRSRGHVLQSASDMNLIPHFYEERGSGAFAELRGMFAAALWDAKAKRLVLARDAVGKKPLFWTCDGTRIAFASELPALLLLLDGEPPLSGAALADYMRLGFVPHPRTIYEDIHALPPGCTLEYVPGGAPKVAPWLAWPPHPDAPSSRAEAIERIDAGLAEAVRLRLRSDVPVGLFLSGGIDSGLVAAHAAAAGARDLLCFVVEVEDAALNEADAARMTAAHLGLPVETVMLSIAPLQAIERIPELYGQPFADSSAIPSFLVSEAAARVRKVVLNGDGGDEVFGGYRRYAAARLAERYAALLAPVARAGAALGRGARRSAGGFLRRIARGYDAATPDERYLAWTVDLLRDAEVARLFPDLCAHGSSLVGLEAMRGERFSAAGATALMRSDYRLILPDDLLVKMDIATMAHSLEARSPLLDVPLTRLARSLPERWLVGTTETKPLLRALARRHLPAGISRLPKRGFEVPVARWLGNELRDVVGDLLLAPDSRVAAMGEAPAVRAFVNGTDGFAGNHPQAVWALLMLELFLRRARMPAGGTAWRDAGAGARG